jgi:glycosyltransferase involved in cell wall biosynthesis
VTVFGLSDATPPTGSTITWDLVSGQRRAQVRSILSPLPLMAARLPLPLLRTRLDRHLTGGQELVVLDHLMAVWALRQASRAREAGLVDQIWYASQNEETAVFRAAVSDSGETPARRLARAIDYPKVARAQLHLLRSADLVTAITREDSEALGSRGARRVEVARPGPPELRTALTSRAADRARAVVIAGSFLWRLKVRNLEAFLEASAARLDRANVQVIVAGRIAPRDKVMLTGRFPRARILGEVDDIHAVYSQGRVAVVPELLGGGFKLKTLDYVYSGLPMAALRVAMNGLPLQPNRDYVAADSIAELVEGVLRAIDDPVALDRMADNAARACAGHFDWAETGRAMVRWFSSVQAAPEPRP